MPPVRSQIINLPKNLPTAVQQEPSLDINQVGNLDIGKVRLDGKLLFRVATPTSNANLNSESSSPITRRVKTIEFHLSDIVKRGFDPDTLKVTSSLVNNQTIIVASDKDWGPRNILTVTPFDVELDEPGSIEKITKRWSKIIEQALLLAWEQRQPKYQKQQIPVVLLSLLAMVVGSFLIRSLQKYRDAIRRRLEQRKKYQLEATESNPSEPIGSSPTEDEVSLQLPQGEPRSGLDKYLPQLNLDQQIGINLILRRVLFAIQFAIWFGGMAMILQRFPQTYAFGTWLLRVPLAYIGIPIGVQVLKLAVDTTIKSNIRHIADRIKESGDADIRLRPRARTILSVLEELTNYLAVLLGLLLFFYIINAIHIILIGIAAIAFLSQDVLKDFLQTYFILLEDQYALGDWVQIGDVNGQVEKISLRSSQVRARCGDLFTIAHGSFTEVTNFSHRSSGIDLYIDVAYSTDLDQAIAVVEQVAKQMQQDSLWGQYIIDVTTKGVESFGDNSITIRLILKTEAGQQWDVGREYRRRLKPAFDQAGINIPFPQRSIWFENALITPKTAEN
ncbi:MAG: mechanosensitive ion channel domain-containing protein [Waterburya sp.]